MNKIKPTRWYYLLAILIPIFACLGTTLLVYPNVPELPGALEAAGIHNLTQVIVPGAADIRFHKSGAYAVYYEYRSVIDGVSYVREKYPPPIKCRLTSKTTGEDIELDPNYIEGNMYATQNDERVGVLIKNISINQPGVYTFSCQYPDGRTYPQIVLAVGPNIVWEFFNIAAKPIAAIICGVLVFVSACGISILIIGFVAFRRHQSKHILAVLLLSCVIYLTLGFNSNSPLLPIDDGMLITRSSDSPAHQTCSLKLPHGEICDGEIPSGCTIFTVSKGDRVFFGGNDDYINPDSYYWVDPGDAENYGVIWIGMPDNVQQGINEVGLAYDANGLPRVDVNPQLEREPVYGNYTSYPIHILHECATIEEVIAWVNTHQWHSYMHDQMHFADATGDAVIISAGEDGEVVFTRKPQGDGYLVSTNFNVANPSNGYYPCWRYETAQELLDGLVKEGDELTAQDATDVLDAVHVEGGASWTIESMVADLPNGIVYLYYFHQFDKPVVLNVSEEIANARAGEPLSYLFPEDVKQEASRRYQHIQSQKTRYEVLGKVWLGLVVASLVVLVIGSINKRQGLIFWIPVVLILGPLGLLVWLVARRKRRVGNWQAILVEAAGDVIPTIVAYITVAVGLILVPGASSSTSLQLLLFFGLPPFIGWSVFQGPLLAFATKKGYLHTLLQRLPHTWVTANMGIAGIFALATPLVNISLQIPLPPWIVVAWWAFAVLSALIGILLLLPYESWSVRRGYQGWCILAWKEGEVNSVPWHKLWWWIPMSFAVLIGGVAGYVFFQQVMR